jgi:hypothetical protein
MRFGFCDEWLTRQPGAQVSGAEIFAQPGTPLCASACSGMLMQWLQAGMGGSSLHG